MIKLLSINARWALKLLLFVYNYIMIMKNIFFLFALLPVLTFAQTVNWINDTIYKDGAPYCLLVKISGSEVNSIYSIRTNTNIEVAIAKSDANNRSFFLVTFLASTKTASFPYSLYFGNKLSIAIVENDLIRFNLLNQEGETRFVAIYNNYYNNSNNTGNPNTSYNDQYITIERDRHGMIFVIGENIKQDNKPIGTCKTYSGIDLGEHYETFSYYLSNGMKCAEATITGIGATKCTIITMKDNATHVIEIQNRAAREDEIVKWLSLNYYL
ncbi:hypothetical protein BH09BAC5_BH09BAC5_16770 [soil metagenome]